MIKFIYHVPDLKYQLQQPFFHHLSISSDIIRYHSLDSEAWENFEIPFGHPNIPKDCGSIEIGGEKNLQSERILGFLVKMVKFEHVQNQPRKKNMLLRIFHQLDSKYSSNFGRSVGSMP